MFSKRVTSRIQHALITVLLLVYPSVARAVEPDDWQQTTEHWYTLSINNQPAGYAVQRVLKNEDRLKTESTQWIRIGRADSTVEVEISFIFVETDRGEPISFSMHQDMSTMVVNSRWEFVDDGVIMIQSLGEGVERVTTLPAPEGSWLMPQAVGRYLKERLQADAQTISYRTITGNAGHEPSMVEHKGTGRETIEHQGRNIEVWNCISTDQSIGMKAKEQYTFDGVLVSSAADIGVGPMKQQLATKQEALAAVQAEAPELLIETMVRLDEPIQHIDKTTAAIYTLTARDGELPDFPSTASQRFERINDASGTLVVNIEDPLAASEAERIDSAYRETSVLIDSDDPLVEKLAQRATARANQDDTRGKVEQMRRETLRLIGDKGLETAFASASETARTRTGDCSEHAVLLCAMIRSQGIPARVATGLLYVDEFASQSAVFAWHMWTQALIDDRWVDVDATLAVPYHAGHIIASTTPLADGVSDESITSLLSLIGNLDIDVVNVTHAD